MHEREHVERLLEHDEFCVWTPLDAAVIEKAEKAGVDVEAARPIGGWCSTENVDRQDEVVVAKGLDFSEFVAFGYFNDNHRQDTSSVLGYPRLARLEKSGWWTEGNLLVGYPPADRVWELAKALKKSRAPRNLGFSIEGKVLERDGGHRIVRAKVRNVAITNCFPGDTRVCGSAESITRRWYDGQLVEINLATGEKLSGTPNHPILTQRGWVALGDLVEGHDRIGRFADDVVRAFRPASFATASPSGAGIPHDVEHVPSCLQQAFDLARGRELLLGVRAGRESDFHGDGRRGNVHVVAVDGFLRRDLEAAFFKKFGESALPATDKETELFAGNCTAVLHNQAVLLTDPQLVGSLQRSEHLASFDRVGGSEQLTFSVVSGFNAFTSSNFDHALSRDMKPFGDSERSLSSSIGFSDLVSKRIVNFSGHVFNLDTPYGWYEANGIVAHNSPVNTDCTFRILSKAFASSSQVEHAARKALAKSRALVQSQGAHNREQRVGGLIHERNMSLSFEEAVDRVRRIHPNISESTCERVVRFAMSS